VIAVADVGGTKIRYGVYDGELKVLGEAPTPKERPIWTALAEAFSDLEYEIISLATMGPLKLSAGRIISNPHSTIKDQELAKPLMEKTGKPVIMINDAVAGAFAEAAKIGTDNLVYVAFGTGIGVGAVVDGNVLLGREGNAHEAGHAVLSLGRGIECGCGKRDHAEALLGGSNIAKFLSLNGFSVRSAPEAFRIIKNDERAFRAFSHALNSFLATVIAFYDPEYLVLGGGVFFKNADVFWRAVRELKDYLLWDAPTVIEASYGELSPLYGAALLGEERPQWLLKRLRYVDYSR